MENALVEHIADIWLTRCQIIELELSNNFENQVSSS